MMRRIYLTAAIGLFVGAAQAQQSLPIQRIILYKNGMAYVVRGGEIDQPLRLSFHPRDMNDVLKTFTAWNPRTNQLYSLGYTTGIPARQLLGRYPFDLTPPGSSLARFLQQVKGAEVGLEAGGRSLSGRLLAVNAEKKVVGESLADDHQVTILQSSGTVETVWLSDVRSLKMSDPQLEGQLQSYLQILAEGSQDVTKEISIYPVPQGGPITASYLQQFPLWKTSYRLQFVEEKSSIEGWALIDNPTGEAWEDVDLTLISGMPVSFVMNLYDPVYTARQTVALPGVSVPVAGFLESAVGNVAEFSISAEPKAAAAPAPPVAGRNRREAMDLIQAPSEAGFSQAESQQLQDYFEYRFPFPVRLGARQSALLPFLRKPIQAERLSLYNQSKLPTNPFSAVRLTNDSGVPLDPGPVTVYQEERYAGEAVIEYTPKGDKRLLGYGVDYEVVVVVDRKTRGPATFTSVKVENGVVSVTQERIDAVIYQLRNKSTREKTVLVEHPRTPGRKLRDAKPEETTENFYRFRVSLDAGEEKGLSVSEVVSSQRALRLIDADPERIEIFFSGAEIPPRLRSQLDEILRVRRELSRLERDDNVLDRQASSISADQQRLRENLKALGTGAVEQPLRERYVKQLGEQEDQLQGLNQRRIVLQEQIRSKREELTKLIEALEF